MMDRQRAGRAGALQPPDLGRVGLAPFESALAHGMPQHAARRAGQLFERRLDAGAEDPQPASTWHMPATPMRAPSAAGAHRWVRRKSNPWRN